MRQENTIPIPVVGLLAARARAECRGGPWWGMGGALAVVGVLGLLVPIPFWDNKIALDAIAAVNIAVTVITIALSTSYDTGLRSAAEAPWPAGAVVAAVLVPRAVVAVAAALGAALVQTAVFVVLRGGEGGEALRFLAGFVAAAFYSLVVLLPWSLVARLALGRIAAPWAVLAFAIVASRLSAAAPTGPLRFASWVVPWLPSANRSSELLATGLTWLYAFAHSGAVGAIAAAFLRRAR